MGATWLEMLHISETRTNERIPVALDRKPTPMGPFDRLPQLKTLIHNFALLFRSVLKQTLEERSKSAIKPCPHSAMRLRKIGSLSAIGGISMRPIISNAESKTISTSVIHILGHTREQEKEALFNAQLYKPLRPMALHKNPPWRNDERNFPERHDENEEEEKPKSQTTFRTAPKAGRPRSNDANEGAPLTKKRKLGSNDAKKMSATVGKTAPTNEAICFKIWCLPPCLRIHCRDGKPDLTTKASYTRTAKITCLHCGKVPAVSQFKCYRCNQNLTICRCTFDEVKGQQLDNCVF